MSRLDLRAGIADFASFCVLLRARIVRLDSKALRFCGENFFDSPCNPGPLPEVFGLRFKACAGRRSRPVDGLLPMSAIDGTATSLVRGRKWQPLSNA